MVSAFFFCSPWSLHSDLHRCLGDAVLHVLHNPIGVMEEIIPIENRIEQVRLFGAGTVVARPFSVGLRRSDCGRRLEIRRDALCAFKDLDRIEDLVQEVIVAGKGHDQLALVASFGGGRRRRQC
jgi:hypothetical protein